MSINFKPDRSKEGNLLGYYISDFIDEKNLAKLIDEIVNDLDTKEIENKYSNIGQNGYHPKMLIKIIFFGYSMGIVTSRKIENGCKYDLRFKYLSQGYQPNWRTISDFRKDNLKVIETYFVDILKYCRELKILNIGKISIDGTKIRANASANNTKTLEQYIEWEKEIRQKIKEINQEGITKDEEESNRLNEVNETIPTELVKYEERLKKIEQAKKRIENRKKEIEKLPVKLKPKSEPKVNFTDFDATFQKGKDNQIKPNYNAQIATTKEDIIVAADITIEANDRKQLIPMIEQTEENTNEKVEEVSADSGYASFENYDYLNEKNIDGYIPDQYYEKDKKKKKNNNEDTYSKNNFKFNSEENKYICPEGKELKYLKKRDDRHTPNSSVYQGFECNNCSKKNLCTKDKNRTITRNNNEDLQIKMRNKLGTPEGKIKYSQRFHMAETPFGHIKQNLRFTQFNLRGKENVRGEFKLLCIGNNLRKIHKYKIELN